jgi:hypothetical protein
MTTPHAVIDRDYAAEFYIDLTISRQIENTIGEYPDYMLVELLILSRTWPRPRSNAVILGSFMLGWNRKNSKYALAGWPFSA